MTKKRKKIVFTNGCFDVLHVGHLRLLNFAKSQGDYLVVGLNSDASVSRLKGLDRPINSFDERREFLLALSGVDEVLEFPIEGNSDNPLEIIQKLRPDIIVKGGDYKEHEVIGSSFINSYGGETIIYPFVPGKSTSAIINRIANRNASNK
jgi:D-beta-D-heptose 7-phosphate kinase/D-beta-D-heptose 1-phosphate adenosyltransferase